jgi:hypothetical protein
MSKIRMVCIKQLDKEKMKNKKLQHLEYGVTYSVEDVKEVENIKFKELLPENKSMYVMDNGSIWPQDWFITPAEFRRRKLNNILKP